LTHRQPVLHARNAFLHVVNEHRWLATSACSLALMQEQPAVRDRARDVLRNVDVAVSGATLLYARSLIEFYTKGSPEAKPRTGRPRQPIDIVIEDFGTGIGDGTYWVLVRIKTSIDVHLLHLTAWRDVDYRSNPKNALARPAAARLNWNREHPEIVGRINDALAEAATLATDWTVPLEALHKAATERLNDQDFAWPANLTGKSAVFSFLDRSGL
jgi:hypothetical protein